MKFIEKIIGFTQEVKLKKRLEIAKSGAKQYIQQLELELLKQEELMEQYIVDCFKPVEGKTNAEFIFSNYCNRRQEYELATKKLEIANRAFDDLFIETLTPIKNKQKG